MPRYALPRFLLLGSLFLAPGMCAAKPLALFSRSSNLETAVAASINESQRSIDVAMYDLGSPFLIAALHRAAERGVAIRIILDENSFNERTALKSTGAFRVAVMHGRDGMRGLMHHKFALFDHCFVVTGSYNWTTGAKLGNYENALWERDPATVNSYAQEFEALWQKSEEANETSWKEPSGHRLFSKASRVLNRGNRKKSRPKKPSVVSIRVKSSTNTDDKSIARPIRL